MARKFKTNVVAGETINGIKIGPRWIGGLCHQAWQVFDSLTKVKGGEIVLPIRAVAVNVGMERGYNKGNLNVEFGRWKRFNNFA